MEETSALAGLDSSSEPEAGDPGEWRRPAALFLLMLAFSTIRPTVLIGLPLILMALALPVRRSGVLILSAVVAVLVLTGLQRDGLWYAERGWAVLLGGSFVAISLRRPAMRFTGRAVAAVAGAAAFTAAFMAVRPGAWGVLDWSVAERSRTGVANALAALRSLQGGGETLSPALVATVQQATEAQVQLFPALVGLASVAGLGVAWWAYVRMGLGARGALGPLQRFRFNDHLVWIFIAGLGLLLAGAGEVWTRAGSNAVVFMGALYAVRGAAVVLFVNGGISLLGMVALAFGLVFLAPVILIGALFIGLGDTWLDLRAKVRSRTA